MRGWSALDGRPGELRRVNGDVRPHVSQLECGPAVQPADSPAERHLDTSNLAIVRVVDLRHEATDGGLGKAYQSHEQTRVRIEAERRGGPAGRVALEDLDLPVRNRRRKADAP